MYADNNALARHRQAVDSLTALLDSVRREALEAAAAECERVATVQASAVDTTARDGGAFFSGGHNAASVCAEAIRALAAPTKPGDEP